MGLPEEKGVRGSHIGIALHLSASCSNPGSRLLDVAVSAQGRGSGAMEFTFPRWIPGSYMIREPFRYVRELTVEDENGESLKWRRSGVDGVVISARNPSKSVLLRYQVLCPELSVRSNHLDSSHLHLMPPYTWFLPTKGCEWAENGGPVSITLNLPEEWSVATQQSPLASPDGLPEHVAGWRKMDGCVSHHYLGQNRDELLDGVFEANANRSYSIEVQGITHHLKLWDAGGHEIEAGAIDRILSCMENIANESFALFGVPKIADYTVILHLTGSLRGGLEHMRSQTSMVPRVAIWPDAKEEWRDLVSLLSHEYVHLWNVKDLRPKKFLDYDLNVEQTTDLLWWFEGGTSWLGDVICVRCGVWSEQDYRDEFKRKMERHLKVSGHGSQSLAESSHEAWIHLYRGHPYSSESQVSYYNDAELALFCLDAEMRRRSGGAGLEQLFAELFNRHGLAGKSPGIEEAEIKLALGKCAGGARLGGFLDQLIHRRARPPLAKAAQTFGLKLRQGKKENPGGGTENDSGSAAAAADTTITVSAGESAGDATGDGDAVGAGEEGGEKTGWLGVKLSARGNTLVISKVESASPLRDLSLPDDELVALDGIRVRSRKALKAALKGKAGAVVKLTLARHDSIIEVSVTAGQTPRHLTTLTGTGNRLWKALLSPQATE